MLTSGRAILKLSPRVHQAGVLHAVSSISMQLGKLNSLKCHPSLRPTPQRVCRQFEGWWGEETDDFSDYQLKGSTRKLKMKSWVITTFFAKRSKELHKQAKVGSNRMGVIEIRLRRTSPLPSAFELRQLQTRFQLSPYIHSQNHIFIVADEVQFG